MGDRRSCDGERARGDGSGATRATSVFPLVTDMLKARRGNTDAASKNEKDVDHGRHISEISLDVLDVAMRCSSAAAPAALPQTSWGALCGPAAQCDNTRLAAL